MNKFKLPMTERGQSSVSAAPGPWAFVQQRMTMAQSRGSILSGLLLEGSDKGIVEWKLTFQRVDQGGCVSAVQLEGEGCRGWDFPTKFPGEDKSLTIGNVIFKKPTC